MPRTFIALTLATLAALSASCGDDAPSAPTGAPSPTVVASEVTGPTGVTARESGPTGTSGPLPPPPPSAEWSGTASLALSGGEEAEVELDVVVDPVTLEPAADLLATWATPDGDYVLVLAWTGESAPEVGGAQEPFYVTIWTPETPQTLGPYSDYAGGCTATLEVLSADAMSGTLDCPSGLKTPDDELPEIRAAGTFRVKRTS